MDRVRVSPLLFGLTGRPLRAVVNTSFFDAVGATKEVKSSEGSEEIHEILDMDPSIVLALKDLEAGHNLATHFAAKFAPVRRKQRGTRARINSHAQTLSRYRRVASLETRRAMKVGSMTNDNPRQRASVALRSAKE